VLFDLPQTAKGPYRAWVEFGGRDAARE
jgi:hypothetical protein